jgi:hypothetical protein
VRDSLFQEKVEKLIARLEEEVRALGAHHHAELKHLQEINAGNLQDRDVDFEKRMATLNAQNQSRMAELESEIDYLKELNRAQRLMLEDNLEYIKGLEEKLRSSNSVSNS